MLLHLSNFEQKILLVTESQHFVLVLCMWADLVTCKIQYIIISFWVTKETWQTLGVLCNVFFSVLSQTRVRALTLSVLIYFICT